MKHIPGVDMSIRFFRTGTFCSSWYGDLLENMDKKDYRVYTLMR